jgi:hypothetical protein
MKEKVLPKRRYVCSNLHGAVSVFFERTSCYFIVLIKLIMTVHSLAQKDYISQRLQLCGKHIRKYGRWMLLRYSKNRCFVWRFIFLGTITITIYVKLMCIFWIMYKVVQIWPGRFVCKQVTVCPGHIWTTLYILYREWRGVYSLEVAVWLQCLCWETNYEFLLVWLFYQHKVEWNCTRSSRTI